MCRLCTSGFTEVSRTLEVWKPLPRRNQRPVRSALALSSSLQSHPPKYYLLASLKTPNSTTITTKLAKSSEVRCGGRPSRLTARNLKLQRQKQKGLEVDICLNSSSKLDWNRSLSTEIPPMQSKPRTLNVNHPCSPGTGDDHEHVHQWHALLHASC